MTKSDFPYLTPDIVQAHELELLKWLKSLWPEHSLAVSMFTALTSLLPLIDAIPAVKEAIQSACDEWNAVTGAEEPTT